MALVEISEVSGHCLNPERLYADEIERPRSEGSCDMYQIDVAGWVIGTQAPVQAVDVVSEYRLVTRIPVRIQRADVAAHHPEQGWALESGYQARVSTMGLASEFELVLFAVFSEADRVPFGTIRGRQRLLNRQFKPKLQPIMLTSVGRTGTTFLMHLLAQHPGIVAHRFHPYETRVANYWMHFAKVLSEPANAFDSYHAANFLDNSLLIAANPYNMEPLTKDREMEQWLGGIYPDRLRNFGQRMIDAFYEKLAGEQGQPGAVYYAEKCLPGHVPSMLWSLYSRPREAFLIRDFRDVLCSILAFNAKRGLQSFGRDRVDSDESFIYGYRTELLPLLEAWKKRRAKAHTVRYEDLILQPEQTIKDLLKYLDLEGEPETIRQMIERASQLSAELKEHQTSDNPKASIRRWRRELSPAAQDACRVAFGDILEEFGYEC